MYTLTTIGMSHTFRTRTAVKGTRKWDRHEHVHPDIRHSGTGLLIYLGVLLILISKQDIHVYSYSYPYPCYRYGYGATAGDARQQRRTTCLQMATSSKELQKSTKKEDETKLQPKEGWAGNRLSRVASRVAAINKEQQKDSTETSTTTTSTMVSSKRLESNMHMHTTSLRQALHTSSMKQAEPPTNIGSLSQLTKVIDQQLQLGNKDASFTLDGSARFLPNDSMGSLLGFNDGVKWRRHSPTTTHNVAVVFGKPLMNDQITVEYASRIQALVNIMTRSYKDDDDDDDVDAIDDVDSDIDDSAGNIGTHGKNDDEKLAYYMPSLVCFCGGVSPGNRVSDADAGYIFFRHLCASQNINLEAMGVDIFLDRTSPPDKSDSLKQVANKIQELTKKWMSTAAVQESSAIDEYGMKQAVQKKQLHVHVTLISTEYHLCSFNDIHHRSHRQSSLRAIDSLAGNTFVCDLPRSTIDRAPRSASDHGTVGDNDEEDDEDFEGRFDNLDGDDEYAYVDSKDDDDNNDNDGNDDDDNDTNVFRRKSLALSSPPIPVKVETSWSFLYATYPFVYAKDESVAFMGKCYLLGEELMPLHVNMKGVVDNKEFFQRDNYLALAAIRRSLVFLVESLYQARPSLRTGLRVHLRSGGVGGVSYAAQNNRSFETVLESALLSLGRCSDLVRPAGLLLSSVSNSDWGKALKALEHGRREIRELCDPDRILEPNEWGKLQEETGLVGVDAVEEEVVPSSVGEEEEEEDYDTILFGKTKICDATVPISRKAPQ